jgi:PIH1 N-terminal domain
MNFDDFQQDLLKDSGLKKLFKTEIQQKPILPLGGFVIKTRIVAGNEKFESERVGVLRNDRDSLSNPKHKSLDLIKLFINVCYSDRLPTNDMINYKEKITSGTFKLPLSLSPLRTDVDKQGLLCYVIDAAINTNPYNLTITDLDFKLFVVDLCIAWVSEKYNCQLATPTLPKMVVKGKLVPHFINRPLRPAIEVVDSSIPKGPAIEMIDSSIADNDVKSKPLFTMLKDSKAKSLVLKVELPREENIDGMELDLEQVDEKYRLLFKSKFYKLDLDLDLKVNLDLAGKKGFDFRSAV